MTNIVLCGGNGTRLWPLSRKLMPKQFLKIFKKSSEEENSLFQLTIARNKEVCNNFVIVSNVEQYFLALDQLEEITNKDNNGISFLLEPIGRNTAPAIALACMNLSEDEIVLVTPSDHLIKSQHEYQKVIQKAKEFAEKNYLVTFGIKPEFAETGYGYIEAEGYDIKAFYEKPNKQKAQEFISRDNFYWNSGMFMFKAGTFLKELKECAPEIFKACEIAYKNSKKENKLIRIEHNDMYEIPEDSIDYAVMEKSKNTKVIPSDISWSDLGSFDSLYKELPKDKNGNTLCQNYIGIDSYNNLIFSKDRKVTTIDIEDLLIIDTSDALLISKKGSSQKVKKAVELIKINSELHNLHQTVHRPWGTYSVLEDKNGYKIKKIIVKPNSRLSLQKHYHRNEHWIVVSGTATVYIDGETKLIRPNESTYIKMGEVHRLENNGKIPVVLIEVQVGEYTAEDDIVRLDDDYER